MICNTTVPWWAGPRDELMLWEYLWQSEKTKHNRLYVRVCIPLSLTHVYVYPARWYKGTSKIRLLPHCLKCQLTVWVLIKESYDVPDKCQISSMMWGISLCQSSHHVIIVYFILVLLSMLPVLLVSFGVLFLVLVSLSIEVSMVFCVVVLLSHIIFLHKYFWFQFLFLSLYQMVIRILLKL